MGKKALIMIRASLLISLTVSLTLLSTRTRADTGTCGGTSITLPFLDVPAGSVFFCSIAEAYVLGLTGGTDPTHYSPSSNVTREQMAAFVTRTMDQSLRRGNKRAALNQYWTTQTAENFGLTDVGSAPSRIQSDGSDVWIANSGDSTVSRVRASDGKRLETWFLPEVSGGVLCAIGKVFVVGSFSPGTLYRIDPTQPPGAVTTVANTLGEFPNNIAYDGQRIWTSNGDGSVSIITLNPVTVTTVPIGVFLAGIIYDGSNMWVSDANGSGGKLHKLDSNGAVILSVDFGNSPQRPAFDGTNIWVPRFTANAVTVVRATGALSGTVIATLTGNGLSQPRQAAFDGERILVTNPNTNSVSLWRASDLTTIGTFSTGAGTFPQAACSDGVNFWVTLQLANKLARF